MAEEPNLDQIIEGVAGKGVEQAFNSMARHEAFASAAASQAYLKHVKRGESPHVLLGPKGLLASAETRSMIIAQLAQDMGLTEDMDPEALELLGLGALGGLSTQGLYDGLLRGGSGRVPDMIRVLQRQGLGRTFKSRAEEAGVRAALAGYKALPDEDRKPESLGPIQQAAQVAAGRAYAAVTSGSGQSLYR